MSGLDEFWPYYVSQHLNRTNRRLHFAGTSAAFVLLALAAGARSWPLAAAAPVAAYGLAWIGHFFFEKNSPATLRRPLLSLRADFRMYALTWSGELDAEILRLAPDLKRLRSGA
jgi:hypothetical protein